MTFTSPGLDVAANLQAVRARMRAAALRTGRDPADITLVAATKGVDPSRIVEAIDAGLTDCGENVVQDAAERIAALGPRAADVRWHLIGHLQTNKVKAALRLFAILQSVDSLRLAEQISRRAEATVPIFLEVNVASEPSKFGFPPGEVGAAIKTITALSHLHIEGLMTVAPAVNDPEQVRPVFRQLRELARANGLTHLSMGMTNDFETAIEEGATIVRVGRAIFGERS